MDEREPSKNSDRNLQENGFRHFAETAPSIAANMARWTRKLILSFFFFLFFSLSFFVDCTQSFRRPAAACQSFGALFRYQFFPVSLPLSRAVTRTAAELNGGADWKLMPRWRTR